jgi:hydroxypyruvate isomerase
MPKFAANLTLMYTEAPFMERFALAARDGFTGVEFLFPYDHDAQAIRQQLLHNNLVPVLHNFPPGNWAAGERGIACLPERIGEFREGVELAVSWAGIIGVRQLNCLAGILPHELDEDLAWQTLTANIAFAAERLSRAGLTLNLEAINSRIDMPGFFLDSGEKVVCLIQNACWKNVKLQFDIYHLQIMSGDLCRRLQTWLPYTGHIQFADNPGRGQPGTGEINFGHIFHTLDALRYQGWVSAEYIPVGPTSDSLDWLRDWL